MCEVVIAPYITFAISSLLKYINFCIDIVLIIVIVLVCEQSVFYDNFFLLKNKLNWIYLIFY